MDEPIRSSLRDYTRAAGGGLIIGRDETETSEVEIGHLPAGTEVDVTFAFSAQPTAEVRARLVGYRVP